MLSPVGKIVFVLLTLLAAAAALGIARRIARIISRGQGQVDWSVAPGRIGGVLEKAGLFQPVWRLRFWPSLFHALVAWGFIYYLLVNTGDALEALIPGFVFLGAGTVGDLYRLLADLLSVAALVGMATLMVRRWVFKPSNLTTRDTTLLHPKARAGIRRDSLIVGFFILIHVGARFLASSFRLAEAGVVPDPWQPFASALAGLWWGLSPAAVSVAAQVFFWIAFGAIFIFVPYFLYSKHIHLVMAPVNFLVRPRRRSPGQLEALDFEDETNEKFGAVRLEDLAWNQILDAYACIMCYRCQEVCPAYNTGKVLSPAALEINKRYFLNQEGARLAAGDASSQTLLEFAITPEAVWACTACGACTDICPVGNDPMRDIMDIRRSLVLVDNAFPEQLQAAYRGMERSANPWNVPAPERLKWAEGLDVPTIEQNPDPEILWWVGCAAATDARAQKIARAFASILNAAGVNYAVLGQNEACTGDSARRSGNEYLFFELASANVETLNEISPRRIVANCPHCLHTLRNEYPAFGGNYEVIHHSQLIDELISGGKLELNKDGAGKVAFHDPCYLGRQNSILDEPRQVIQGITGDLVELPRSGRKSFCCGAGGAQMWKEEEEGTERVSANRMQEVVDSGAGTLAVGCPFCMIMLTDAAKAREAQIQVLDVAEIVAAQLKV
ncbi:MAG TPA: heterodisulfide reductase-related iron-sulfur binding cluster [Anaerolineales bacterium]|nr:heterodisulfide reductase-related iron-sulfur binding cluster [Anaerolineales bacterium]